MTKISIKIFLVVINLLALIGIYGVINDTFIHNIYFESAIALRFFVYNMFIGLPIGGLVMIFRKSIWAKIIGSIYLVCGLWSIKLLLEALV